MGTSIRKSKNIRRYVKKAFREGAQKRFPTITFQFAEGDLVTPVRSAQGYDIVTELPITLKAGEVCMVTESAVATHSSRSRPMAYADMVKVMHSGYVLYINPRLLRFLEDDE